MKIRLKENKNLKMLNEKGFTIIEPIIALSILIIMSLISYSSINQVKGLSKRVNVSESSEKTVLQIIENVRTNMTSFKSTSEYYTDASALTLLEDVNLVMAWDINKNTKKTNCIQCKGRYGFVMQPYEDFRGLYILTMKFTHESWNGNPKIYKFLVSSK